MDVVDLPHSDAGPRDALAVVLLHGFPLDHRMWGAQAKALQQAGFRVVVPDLRGHGKAPVGRGAPSVPAMADDVLRLADRAGLRRFVLGGFSMGGYVALDVARRAPDRLAGLLLADTRAEADSEDARQARAATAAKVRAQGMEVLAESMLPKLLSPATLERRPALAEEVRRTILANPPEGAAQALLAMGARADARPWLGQIHAPTLVVAGSDDAIAPVEAARALAVGIAGARLEVVPEAGHLSPVEQPEAFNRALLDWLPTLVARGGRDRAARAA